MATYSTKFSFTVPCSKEEFNLLREIMEGDPFPDILTFAAAHQKTKGGEQVWFQSRQHGNPSQRPPDNPDGSRCADPGASSGARVDQP